MRTSTNPQSQQTASRKFGVSHVLLIIGLSTLLCGEAWFGYRLHQNSDMRQEIKEDYSLSNNVTFGLFSVDQWRDRISAVLGHQVQDFSITAAQKKALQSAVEKQLHGLIAKTIAQIDKPQKSLVGKLKKLAFNALVDSDDVQAQVRPFAKTIVAKVSSPASQKRLKHIASSKMGQLINQTYDSTSTANYMVTKHMYQKYHVSDPISFNKRINERLASLGKQANDYTFAMLGCVVFALLLWALMRNQEHLHTTHFVLSLLFAAVLLIVGITVTVIEVDARLESLNFTLLGEKVVFQNQVLFFQSKSIWAIVKTLIAQPKPDAVFVGALIFIFVILMPMIRLLARGLHILSPNTMGKNRVVNYLAFECAKWDMSDVMIVGILMTFIGLNGILKSQLSNLNIHDGPLTTTTVNYTSLQPGYYIFTGYVVLGIILSYVLRRITTRLPDTVISKK